MICDPLNWLFFFFLYSIVFSRFIHDACTSILNCQKIFHCEDYTTFCLSSSLPGSASCKEPACQCRRHMRQGFDPSVRKIPWSRAQQSAPVFLPGESRGQRCLAGYSPWGHEELDMTEVTQHLFIHSSVGGHLG